MRKGSRTGLGLQTFFSGQLLNLILLLLSGFLLVQVSGYARMARAFPRLILILVLVLVTVDILWAIYGMIRSQAAETHPPSQTEAVNSSGQEAEAVTAGRWARKQRVLSTILLMFLFLAFMVLLGFVLGAFLFLLCASWVLGYRNLKRLSAASLGITCFIYVIFILIMESRLPRGLLLDLVLR